MSRITIFNCVKVCAVLIFVTKRVYSHTFTNELTSDHNNVHCTHEHPKADQVLTALSFYASGSYQRFIGVNAHHKMHQVSVSNCIRAVTLALNNEYFRGKYMKFPQTRQERNIIKHGFYQKFAFPGILGCIDGTHIAVVRPSEYEERYFNRKRYHSLNAQIICDSDLNILSVDASHGGATHDSHVWNNHPIKSHLQNLHASENETLWLLGDSGYPLRATLMTPIVNTQPDTPERYYTDLHCKVRNSVERCIGVLKSRWRCLLVDRKLHYDPVMAGYMTNACCVLHNIVNGARLPVPELTPQQQQYESSMQVIRGVHIEPAHIVKKRSIDQPLRISIFYDHSVYRLDADKFYMINNTILPEAVKFWEDALKVRKTGGPIRLNRKCPTRQVFIRGGRSHCIDACSTETMCGEVKVPERHLNPCYVCNSTGHNCQELPRPVKVDDEDAATEISDNAFSDATEAPVEDEVFGVENTDFVLYVSAVETERCRRGLTVAYASHCQQEAALDRPVAGHANFCPGELSTKYRDLPSVLSTVKHEMLHALGFSVSLFGFYRDENGEPLTERRPDTGNPPLDEELQIHKWSERVVRNVTRRNWMIRGGYMERTFHMIVTPRVVKEVREHFNCSALEGAELEDQGGDGTAFTHWEKRVFENEAMTGTHTQNSVFSRITLAMMEDTGWYRADYRQAAPLAWGKGLGCNFAMASCKQWLNAQRLRRKNPAPFCERVKGEPLRTECSAQRNAVVLCNLVRHDNILPRAYQHFDTLPNVPPGDEAYYGGSVSLADYCPYLQEFTWKHKSVLVRGSRCSYEENTPKVDVNFALENYGAHSKCFDHSDRVWEQKSCRQIREWQHWGSGCYKYKCESGRLHIVVGNYSYTCYFAGQILQVRIIQSGWLHKGGVVCPPCRELCGEEFYSRKEYCKAGEEAPPPNLYPNDVLACRASTHAPAILFTAAILLTTIFHWDL